MQRGSKITVSTVFTGIKNERTFAKRSVSQGPLDEDGRHTSGKEARQPNSRGCFVCGLGNPIGLKMVFHEDCEKAQVRAELTVPDTYRSYPGVVHGGIVATILDETSALTLTIHMRNGSCALSRRPEGPSCLRRAP